MRRQQGEIKGPSLILCFPFVRHRNLVEAKQNEEWINTFTDNKNKTMKIKINKRLIQKTTPHTLSRQVPTTPVISKGCENWTSRSQCTLSRHPGELISKGCARPRFPPVPVTHPFDISHSYVTLCSQFSLTYSCLCIIFLIVWKLWKCRSTGNSSKLYNFSRQYDGDPKIFNINIHVQF